MLHNDVIEFVFTAVTCPPVPTVSHASSNTTLAISLTVVEIHCDEGYWFSIRNTSTIITCLDTGFWSQHVEKACQGKKKMQCNRLYFNSHSVLFIVDISGTTRGIHHYM